MISVSQPYSLNVVPHSVVKNLAGSIQSRRSSNFYNVVKLTSQFGAKISYIGGDKYQET